jgi:hypothetical protein
MGISISGDVSAFLGEAVLTWFGLLVHTPLGNVEQPVHSWYCCIEQSYFIHN